MQQYSSSSHEITFPQIAPQSNSMVRARIDVYLDKTCAPLFLSLPKEEAIQQRAEMRSHLENLIEAHIELGFSETEAMTLALEQFGKEQSVARAWKQECEETNVERGSGTILSALRPVVGYSLLNWTIWLFLMEAVVRLVNGLARGGVRLPEFLVWVALAIFAGQYTLFPAFLGFLVGRRASGRTLAPALLAIPFTITMCGSFVMKIFNICHLLPPAPGFSSEFPALDAVLPHSLYLGFAAIGVGAALLRRRRARRLAGSR